MPTQVVTVRAATPAEHPAVADLTVLAYADGGHLHAHYEPELRDVARRALEAEVLVAEVGGRLVGSVTFVPGGQYGEVLRGGDEASFRMLAVAPSAQGLGTGRALAEACLARARALGRARVVISSQPSMTGAHALYASMGFRRLPERDWFPLPDVPLWVFGVDL